MTHTVILARPRAGRDSELTSRHVAQSFERVDAAGDPVRLTAHSTARHPRFSARARRRSAESKQRRLRRCSRPERGRRHRLLAPLPPMREYPLNDLRLLDARNHVQASAAARALLELDSERAALGAAPRSSERPSASAAPERQRTCAPRLPSSWGDRRSQRRVRREDSVKSRQMYPRRRHERSQPGDEVQRLQHDVRPVAVRSLQSVADLPLRRESEPFHRHRRAAVAHDRQLL
jgi:hypothetical protein